MISIKKNYWKARAIDRRMENKALKKRIKELQVSRDGWKGKYMRIKEDTVVCQSELNTIKKNDQNH